MRLRQLAHFESLYQLRSFARAAIDHGLTQSALSRSLQKLESEIGQRLFDRTTHLVEPTDAAHGLIQRARDVVDAARAFEEEAEQLRGSATGHVRIGTGPFPAQPLLTGAIRNLAGGYPGIQVSVVAGTARDLLTALLGRDLDFVVCDMSKYEDLPVASDIDVIELPAEPLVAVMSVDHPLASRHVDMSELASAAWAMPTPAPISVRDLPAPFSEAFASGRFPFYRLETTAACLELARSGHAITMVPRSLALSLGDGVGLVHRAAPSPLRTNDGIHLVRHRTRSPAARLLIDEIQHVATAIAGVDEPAARGSLTRER